MGKKDVGREGDRVKQKRRGVLFEERYTRHSKRKKIIIIINRHAEKKVVSSNITKRFTAVYYSYY